MRARSQGLRTGTACRSRRGHGDVLVGRAHREFVAVELAQRHGAGLGQLAHHGGVEGRAVAGQDARAGGGREVGGDEDVLVRDRHAGQRRRVAGGDARVGRAGLGQRHVFVERDEGAQVLVLLACAPGSAAPPRPPTPCASRSAAASCGHAHLMQVAALIRSPSAPGTGRASTAGALRWLASRWFGSLTTSSRRRSVTSCDGGHRMRQRLDAGGVDRAHLLDQVEEAVDLGQHALALVGRQAPAGRAMAMRAISGK